MFITEKAPETSGAVPRTEPTAAAPAPSRPALTLMTDPVWLFGAIWRRKGLVLLCGLLGTVLAILASLAMPPRYMSTAQLFIDPRDLRVLQNEISPNAIGSDPTSTTAYLESQARVIASDSIKARVVENLHLDKDPEFGGEAGGKGLAAWLGFGRAEQDGARNAMLYALAKLDKKVSVRRGERTFVIDITATARDPEKAARIANALADAYLEDQSAVRDALAKRTTDSLTGRLAELRDRLRQAEDKAERFKEANRLVGSGGKTIAEEQLALNNAGLVAARTRVTEARAKYDEIARTRASAIESGAIPEAVASNTMTALRAQLGAARSKEADLLASLGARHPALVAARSQVADARRQIDDELARIARAARSELDRAVATERQLAGRVEELQGGQVAASRASVELRELEREVESSRVVYEGFLKRARETGELAGIDTTNARIISAAMPALQKSGISRRGLALAGGVGGLALGCLLAIGLALLGLRIRPRREPEAAEPSRPEPAPDRAPPPPAPAPLMPLAEPVAPAPSVEQAPVAEAQRSISGWRRFTTINGGQGRKTPEKALDAPSVATAQLMGRIPAVRHRRWRREPDELRSVFQGKGPLVDVLDKPQGAFARAIAELGKALAAHGGAGRRILVLGLRPGVGASTVALNLALDAALAGRVAMLVDSGTGAAGLTASVAPEAQGGLHDVLAGTAGIVRVALQDEGTGLFFLPRRGPTATITSAAIARDFFGAAKRFGPIVVDGGDIGADELTQAFAGAVDDILLVARENSLRGGDMERLTAALGANVGKLRGFVVNEA